MNYLTTITPQITNIKIPNMTFTDNTVVPPILLLKTNLSYQTG